jgi:hypothetical protein
MIPGCGMKQGVVMWGDSLWRRRQEIVAGQGREVRGLNITIIVRGKEGAKLERVST